MSNRNASVTAANDGLTLNAANAIALPTASAPSTSPANLSALILGHCSPIAKAIPASRWSKSISG